MILRETAEPVAIILQGAAIRLAQVADNPRLEARLLLAHALGVSQNDLIREPQRRVATASFETLINRRLAHEPMALILGRREFWSLDFLVSAATLVPRPDSETLIEAALALPIRPRRILDLGTGTGCLLLSLLHVFTDAFGVGADIAPAAAALARTNAIRLGLDDRAAFYCGDWTNAISGRFDLVVSNPPYIRTDDIPALMPEVALHEPRSALDGGSDGYSAYRAILPRLRSVLSPKGTAILELGAGQAEFVATLATRAGFAVSIQLDLREIPRAMVVSYPIG